MNRKKCSEWLAELVVVWFTGEASSCLHDAPSQISSEVLSRERCFPKTYPSIHASFTNLYFRSYFPLRKLLWCMGQPKEWVIPSSHLIHCQPVLLKYSSSWPFRAMNSMNIQSVYLSHPYTKTHLKSKRCGITCQQWQILTEQTKLGCYCAVIDNS